MDQGFSLLLLQNLIEYQCPVVELRDPGCLWHDFATRDGTYMASDDTEEASEARHQEGAEAPSHRAGETLAQRPGRPASPWQVMHRCW